MKNFIQLCNKAALKFWGCGVIRLRTVDPNKVCLKFRLFNRTIATYGKEKKKRGENAAARAVYLKVNRQAPYTIPCVQSWLDALRLGGGGIYKFYFICDNRKLAGEILQRCTFENGDIPFMRSMKRYLRRRAKPFYSTWRWRNAAYAHLTTFFHARRIGAKQFWNIDADDTLLFMPEEKVYETMRQVEQIVEEKQISAMSLDMWYSKTRGIDWTFGVTYINDNIDFCRIFESVRDRSWSEHFRDYETKINFDWYLTYMKHFGKYKIESFYVDGCYFLHGGEYVLDPVVAWLCVWREGQVYFPLADVLHLPEIREFPLIESCKISVGMTEEASLRYYRDRFGGYHDRSTSFKRLIGFLPEDPLPAPEWRLREVRGKSEK